MTISSLTRSTITNSVRYEDFLAGNPAASSFYSIATATGTGSNTTITFSSIPSTYTHIQLRMNAVMSGIGLGLRLTINGDTGANYTQHALYGSNATAAMWSNTSQTYADLLQGNAGVLTYPNVGIIDFTDYASTAKYKTMRARTGYENNTTSGRIIVISSAWLSTVAINSISIATTGGSFTTNTTIALYGVK